MQYKPVSINGHSFEAPKFDKFLTQSERTVKWDNRFLELAKLVSSWSKDPSTQTGCVFVDYDQHVISLGYNGFPKGINDSKERYENRELKYSLILHCETNALLSAKKDLTGATMYTFPFMSCSRCAVNMIQAGIKRAVAPKLPIHLIERWGKDCDLSASLFAEAGVELWLYDGE